METQAGNDMTETAQVKVKQLVRVMFDAGSRHYTYGWFGLPLDVGDVVEVPSNWAFPEGGRVGTVAAIGSTYTGPIQWLIRKI